MNTTVKVLLILLALAAIYGFITRNKRGKSQEQLLNEMSRKELEDFAIRVKEPERDANKILSMSDDQLRAYIRRKAGF